MLNLSVAKEEMLIPEQHKFLKPYKMFSSEWHEENKVFVLGVGIYILLIQSIHNVIFKLR